MQAKMTREEEIFGLVCMWLLVIANLIVFCVQPTDWSVFNKVSSGHNFGGLVQLFMAPIVFFYVVLIIIVSYFIVRTIYNHITKKECLKSLKIATIGVLCSLCLVSYGTFFKKAVEENDRKNKRNAELLIKLENGYEIEREGCIWRGDTIICKFNYLQIDTLVMDEESNTCHWTNKPMINYKIAIFNKDKFTQDADTTYYHPLKYTERMQYVINLLNNKEYKWPPFPNDIGADDDVYNDSILCYLFKTSKHDSKKQIGYLYFTVNNNVYTLKDSCKDVYRLRGYVEPDEDYRISIGWGSYNHFDKILPLIKTIYQKKKKANDDFIYYYDYFDISQKKFVLCNVPYWEEYIDPETEKLVYITSKFDYRQPRVNNYPAINYYTTLMKDKYSREPADTTERGRYIMKGGKYVKELKE